MGRRDKVGKRPRVEERRREGEKRETARVYIKTSPDTNSKEPWGVLAMCARSTHTTCLRTKALEPALSRDKRKKKKRREKGRNERK